MYLTRRNPNFVPTLGKLLAGSMIERTPFSAPGYYVSTIEFAEGRGPTLSELSDFDAKARVAVQEKYGKDNLEIGYLTGKLQGQEGEFVLAPSRLLGKEYVPGSLKFNKETAYAPYPEDANAMKEGDRLKRAYCISWVKKPCNFDDSLAIPESFIVKENGTYEPEGKRMFFLKTLGLTAKPIGELTFKATNQSIIQIGWYDKDGTLVLISGTSNDGVTHLFTPDEVKQMGGLEGMGIAFTAATGLTVSKIILCWAIIALVASLAYVLVSNSNKFVTTVDPKTGKEIRTPALVHLMNQAIKGTTDVLKKVAIGVGIGAAILIPTYAFFKWGLPAIREYQERKMLEETK